ncbi:MAG: hypothetical protein R6V52_03820 [Bacteroidales bacterium]
MMKYYMTKAEATKSGFGFFYAASLQVKTYVVITGQRDRSYQRQVEVGYPVGLPAYFSAATA